jgi:hypothetical protein
MAALSVNAQDLTLKCGRGGEVTTKETVYGKAKARSIKSVCVVIHPHAGGYWNQGITKVDAASRNWSMGVQFGEKGLYSGHSYTVQAFGFATSDPGVPIGEIQGPPAADFSSNEVVVKKK